MTAKTKLAQKRLTLLQLAEKLGNVSKACQMHKVSRSQFYEYKRAFQLHGLDGLIDNQVCGTCYYFGFKGLEKYCRHPGHAFAIQQWGIGCPDWYDMFNKDPRKTRPQRLPLETLNEHR